MSQKLYPYLALNAKLDPYLALSAVDYVGLCLHSCIASTILHVVYILLWCVSLRCLGDTPLCDIVVYHLSADLILSWPILIKIP